MLKTPGTSSSSLMRVPVEREGAADSVRGNKPGETSLAGHNWLPIITLQCGPIAVKCAPSLSPPPPQGTSLEKYWM